MAKKQAQTDPTSVNLVDRIQNNILVILITLGVAVASVTAGVMHYLSNQQENLLRTKHETAVQSLVAEHKEDLAELRTRLQSIERRLGNNDFFDVRQFFLDDARKLQLSMKAQFYGEAGFYAPIDETRWQYVTMSELEFAGHILGKQNPLYAMLTSMAPQSQSFGTVHLWKGVDEKLVEGPSPPIRRLFPYISVQRVSYEDLFGEIHNIAQDRAEMLFTAQSEEARQFKEFAAETAAKIFRGDAVGAALSGYLFMQGVMTSMFSNANYYIQNLQKTGNVVYLQSITTLSDVTIDGEHYANYFVTEEVIMISTPEALYFVQTSVPNHEPAPRNEYFVWVSEWLSDFAVVVK
ncbi:MAG: hypothetical protein IH851_12670 [Armatimonadetes bacterium]|nr:hypothetical protein [Armatimonadota bacterium]